MCCHFLLYQFLYFNPRPRKEGDNNTQKADTQAGYFNPRPRKEGDVSELSRFGLCDISIHALAKRATLNSGKMSQAQFISIHALAKRATFSSCPLGWLVFISIHALAKRATRQTICLSGRYNISIHALAKRATYRQCELFVLRIFQSTPSQRGRPRCRSIIGVDNVFQSTPSQRGRLLQTICLSGL